MVDNESRIREIECDVLDRHHNGQPLLRCECDVAAYNMLLAYGHTIRILRGETFSSMDFDSKLFHATAFLHGLDWSLRWIIQHCPCTDSPEIDWPYFDREAVELLGWGRQYAELVNVHTAWSRGEMRASLDESQRIIRFDFHDRFEKPT